jgi:O-6-methylguanine DNA methyltransferase
MRRWCLGPADLLAGCDAHGPCTAWVEPGATAPPSMRRPAGSLRGPDAIRDDPTGMDDLVHCIERWLRDPSIRPQAGLMPHGAEFHSACWRALGSVPPGRTITYAELASLAGRPRACRAAAQAMARNRLAPLIPCHRVVAAAGIGGFMGRATGESAWPLRLKRWLLKREGLANA